MKNYQEETIKMLSQASDRLAQFVAHSAFEFWQRKDFRLYVNFPKIGQTEQDRMFNELEVSILGLFILHLEQPDAAVRKEYEVVLHALRDDLASGFLKLLADTGIEKHYIKIFEKLIDMRLKEYREDLQLALKESKNMKEFAKHEEQLRITWARIETITIDCLTHIRRGDVKEGDPLWKLLRKWFITLDAQLNPITEAASKE